LVKTTIGAVVEIEGEVDLEVVQEEIGVEEEDLVWIKVHLLSLCLMEHMFIVLKILLLLNVQIAQEFLSLIEEFIYNQKQK
jgi:hypothetical protein